MKTSKSTSTRQDARERLILAAIQVFEREGVRGATTREIARVAEVNEVTLFRHFHNKDGLLSAVMEHKMLTYNELLEMESIWTGDLARDLREYGRALYRALRESEPFIRMLIGEAKRHPDYTRQVMIAATQPAFRRFSNLLRQAAEAGHIRNDLHWAAAGEAFTNVLLCGMLCETALWMTECTPEEYVETALTMFIDSLTAPRP